MVGRLFGLKSRLAYETLKRSHDIFPAFTGGGRPQLPLLQTQVGT